jgi:hypothetical protein
MGLMQVKYKNDFIYELKFVKEGKVVSNNMTQCILNM